MAGVKAINLFKVSGLKCFTYIQETPALRTREGTEKLEELLIRKYSISKINSFEELTRKKGLLILIGTSLSTVLKVCTYSKCKIFWLKTATYSNKRYIVEYLLNIFLSWKINTIVITNTQKKDLPFFNQT